MIREPTLEYYFYYLRRLAGDSGQALREHRAAYEADLRLLLSHLERLSDQVIPAWNWPDEKEERHISQRIMRTGWLRNPGTGRACFVEARTYGDIYWLQVGYDQNGQAEPDIFRSLRAEAWQPSAAQHLLGQSTYLCGIAAKEMEKLASQILTAYLDHSPDRLAVAQLADRRAVLYRHQPYLSALLYPDAKGEQWAGQVYLNQIAPRLELYQHKVDRQLAWCEQNFPKLSEQERSLRQLLEQAGHKPSANASLWEQLARLCRVFDANLGMFTDRQTTIEINLRNLDFVLGELEPPGQNGLLKSICTDLHRRYAQLDADLASADQVCQRAERMIRTLTMELGLARSLASRPQAEESASAEVIERCGFPGTLPMLEGNVVPPRIEAQPAILLTPAESTLLQQIFPGYQQVKIEKEFYGGYSGMRVLMTQPITASGRKAALTVTKLGPADQIGIERANYEQFVEPYLPFCVAPLKGERYYEQDGYSILNCAYIGEGSLGQARDLEACYRSAVSSRGVASLIRTLDDLLDKELGQHWYAQAVPTQTSFGAEYGRHLVEHLRLRLRPGTADQFWQSDRPPPADAAYQPIGTETLPNVYAAIAARTAVTIEGLIVRRIKSGLVKLGCASDPGIVIRVEFDPGCGIERTLHPGARMGLRGEVVHNRQERLEQITRSAFPELVAAIHHREIALTSASGMFPNPLKFYPDLLQRALEPGWQSYVHGDLHLHNVLVDDGGHAWLIDFARVEERHNLFDFIKLETYVRLMALANAAVTFSLNEYVHFERSLIAATLAVPGGGSLHKLLVKIRAGIWQQAADPCLATAYELILSIRQTARNYMKATDGFSKIYFPALFLYCLAVMKYFQASNPQPTRLAFATACVLGELLAREPGIRVEAGQGASE
ncbi:MAG: phosphotransferase [Anaerolineales bacterium]|nr:phosphotransferase [Anaerolineales bacterium]